MTLLPCLMSLSQVELISVHFHVFFGVLLKCFKVVMGFYLCSVLKQPAIKRAVGIPETAHLAPPVTAAPTAGASVMTLSQPPKRTKKDRR